MVVLVYYLTNLLFFDIPLLNYYYINLSISKMCCTFSRDKYLSFGVFVAILWAMLFPVKLTDSTLFWIAAFNSSKDGFFEGKFSWEGGSNFVFPTPSCLPVHIFFATRKCQKSKKTMKAVNIEGENLHDDLVNYSEIFREDVAYDDIKLNKKQG